MKIKLLVGIGNNFRKYLFTRHNIGIWFINIFLKIKKINLIYKKELNGYFYKSNKKYDLNIFIPKCYMNLSGIYIKDIINILNINSNEMLVVYDDININIGVYKLSYNKKFSSHNGIKNIIENIKSNNFYKLRIGINKNNNDTSLSNYVLSKPNNIEKKEIIHSIYNSINFLVKEKLI